MVYYTAWPYYGTYGAAWASPARYTTWASPVRTVYGGYGGYYGWGGYGTTYGAYAPAWGASYLW